MQLVSLLALAAPLVFKQWSHGGYTHITVIK